MENLSQNPHLVSLLEAQNLSFINMEGSYNFSDLSQSGFGVFAHIGDLDESGVIVGATERGGKKYYVIYDPAKEGQDDALTLKEIA